MSTSPPTPIVHDQKVHHLPIERITVLNGRTRGKPKFKQIVANIAALGLKKPITVARRAGDGTEGDGERYVLCCGQGRLEAYLALGQSEIPAIIVEAKDEQVLLMSLAENLARRPRSTVELAREIADMKERGYKAAEIAKKVDLHPSYVNGMVNLLQRGETCLLTALERRTIPMSVAIMIAESTEEDVQRPMTEAYEKGELKGKALLRAPAGRPAAVEGQVGSGRAAQQRTGDGSDAIEGVQEGSRPPANARGRRPAL